MASSIKKKTRKGKTKIDDSFIACSKDKKKVRIKPFMVTINKVPKSIAAQLRLKSRELLTNALKEMNFEDFVINTISNHLPKEISKKLKKSPLQSGTMVKVFNDFQ